MADYDGSVIPLLGFSGGTRGGFEGSIVRLTGGLPAVPILRFKMRGWNTSTLDWEVWVSEEYPDPSPPIGPCIAITVVSVIV